MNLNLNLSFKPDDLKKMLPYLWRAEPYIFGIVLIAVFGYTAYAVNAALNVGPASQSTLPQPAAKITFTSKADQETIASLKTLQTVQGNVSTGSIGTNNPF
jgi:hypothetical protein